MVERGSFPLMSRRPFVFARVVRRKLGCSSQRPRWWDRLHTGDPSVCDTRPTVPEATAVQGSALARAIAPRGEKIGRPDLSTQANASISWGNQRVGWGDPETHKGQSREVNTMLKEFKEFAVKGNVVDMAVGIIIGAAFGTIVKSLVADVIMPPIGLLLGGVDFENLFILLREGTTVSAPYAALADAKAAGAVTINYGAFLNTVISFLIVAFSVFILVRGMNTLKKKEEAKPAAPPAPSAQEVLLTEIRDLLAKAK